MWKTVRSPVIETQRWQGPESVAQPPPKPRRHRVAGATVATFVVLASLAVYAAVHQGVDTIDLKRATVSFKDVQPAQIEQQQVAVQADLATAKSEARRKAVGSPTIPDISGQWVSDAGLTYVVTQYGDQAVIQEQSPYGVTAVGQGTVTETSASFGFRAFNGVTGLAVLQFAADGTAQATFTNSLGQSSQATLTQAN